MSWTTLRASSIRPSCVNTGDLRSVSKEPAKQKKRIFPMAETMKKPTSNRSAKDRRNTLFRVLDGVLSLSHKKFMPEETAIRQSRAGHGYWFQQSQLTAAYSKMRNSNSE